MDGKDIKGRTGHGGAGGPTGTMGGGDSPFRVRGSLGDVWHAHSSGVVVHSVEAVRSVRADRLVQENASARKTSSADPAAENASSAAAT